MHEASGWGSCSAKDPAAIPSRHSKCDAVRFISYLILGLYPDYESGKALVVGVTRGLCEETCQEGPAKLAAGDPAHVLGLSGRAVALCGGGYMSTPWLDILCSR